MITVLTVGGNPVNVVSVPNFAANPKTSSQHHMRVFEVQMFDSVAKVMSPFTGQTQRQGWPGADGWMGTITLPPLTQNQTDLWECFLAECRGIMNPFLLGDPRKSGPRGTLHSSKPVVDLSTAVTNNAGTTKLATRGWTANNFGLLLPNDYIQIGYRLHKNINPVNSDASGKAVLDIWPSLREQPTDGQQVILANPQGLFCLGDNKRGYSAEYTGLTKMSIPVMEYR